MTTTTDLIKQVAEATELTQVQIKAVLSAITDAVTTNLKAGEDVRISGLGTFVVKQRAARVGRNPATGDEIQIPESKAITFRVTKPLKDEIKVSA